MKRALAEAIKRKTPWPLRRLSRKIKRAIRARRDGQLPCKAVFTRIYERNEWGGKPGEFYSGPGSDAKTAQPYAAAVREFMATHGVNSVLDLGCGDFRVGRMIAPWVADYTGVDIVEAVVARNQALHGNAHVRFLARNVIEDELPDADLCLAREVLQHLSNAEIQRVLAKLAKFKHVIITDAQPGGAFIPNIDKPHGQTIRLYRNSALALDKPPFNLKNVELLLETALPVTLRGENEKLRSFVVVCR